MSERRSCDRRDQKIQAKVCERGPARIPTISRHLVRFAAHPRHVCCLVINIGSGLQLCRVLSILVFCPIYSPPLFLFAFDHRLCSLLCSHRRPYVGHLTPIAFASDLDSQTTRQWRHGIGSAVGIQDVPTWLEHGPTLVTSMSDRKLKVTPLPRASTVEDQ